MTDAAGFPDFRKRKDQNFLQILNRILLILIGLVVAIAFLAAFVPALRQRTEQKTALEDIRRQVAQERLNFQNRNREVARLNNDPEYLGNIARDKLDLMKKGETIFRFDNTSTSVSAVVPIAPAAPAAPASTR